MLSEADQLRGLAGKAICRQSRRIEHRACLGCLLACPLKNGSGDIVGINVAAEEITDRKRAESESCRQRGSVAPAERTLAERAEARVQERIPRDKSVSAIPVPNF